MLIKIHTPKMLSSFSQYFRSQVGLDIALGTRKVRCLVLGSVPALFGRFPVCHPPDLWWDEQTWHVP